jgi:hypothetical protein
MLCVAITELKCWGIISPLDRELHHRISQGLITYVNYVQCKYLPYCLVTLTGVRRNGRRMRCTTGWWLSPLRIKGNSPALVLHSERVASHLRIMQEVLQLGS